MTTLIKSKYKIFLLYNGYNINTIYKKKKKIKKSFDFRKNINIILIILLKQKNYFLTIKHMQIIDEYKIYKIAGKIKLSDAFYENINIENVKYYIKNYKENIKREFININDNIKIHNKDISEIKIENGRGSTKILKLIYNI